ncbi:MAG: endonuclease/exonuclease/phosphatase family protein [Planctomycetota bacterium]
MPTPLRIASFNVENLFTRAKILNLSDHSVVTDALAKVGELDALLRKPAYTPATKAKILAQYKQLSVYITVREDRDKLFDRAKSKVVASGAGDWDGAIEFKRAKFSEMARENTAQVLKKVNADIACIVEAEDRPSLWDFNRELLDSKKFPYAMLIDGNDQRGIDVGVLSKRAIRSIQTHIYDGPANSRTFSRDCLRVELEWTKTKSIHVLCNHFKSKSGGDTATDARRKRQAERVAEILKDYDLKKDLVIVAGDLNDTPNRPPLQPLLGLANLFDVLALQFPNVADRWTYHYKKHEQIDYLLVSKPLRDAFVRAGVERRGIYQLSKLTNGAETEFSTVTKHTDAASDHGAVWAEFAL